jgi:2-keto-3-deoxy-L-rhamnonate aldolase RhmA
MESARRFVEKIKHGGICVGTGITFSDATVTEALCGVFDFVWIDMEHNALSLEAVQAHLMATKGSRTLPMVRVRANDPIMIKTVLDIGAPGIIVPMIRTVQEATLAVQACRYPPQGIRGIGPRRASDYGRLLDADFFRKANEASW